MFFYGTDTRHEKALTTNIPRVRDLEETVLCPRVMPTNTFFPCNLFFLCKIFYRTKRRSKTIKL